MRQSGGAIDAQAAARVGLMGHSQRKRSHGDGNQGIKKDQRVLFGGPRDVRRSRRAALPQIEVFDAGRAATPLAHGREDDVATAAKARAARLRR